MARATTESGNKRYAAEKGDSDIPVLRCTDWHEVKMTQKVFFNLYAKPTQQPQGPSQQQVCKHSP